MSPASPDPYLVTALNQTAQKLPFKKNIFKKTLGSCKASCSERGKHICPECPLVSWSGCRRLFSGHRPNPDHEPAPLCSHPACFLHVCGDTVPSGRLGASAFRKYCLSPRICPAPHHHSGIEARAGSQPSITCLCWRRRTGWPRDCLGVGWGWGDGALVQEAASIY